MACSLSGQGKYAEAEQMQREVHAAQKRVLGAEHPDTLMTARNLARSLSAQGKHVEGPAGAAEAQGRERDGAYAVRYSHRWLCTD